MGVKYHDYYETLGITKGSSDKEIKSAYRKMARKYHPDVNKESESDNKKEITRKTWYKSAFFMLTGAIMILLIAEPF